MPDHRKKRDSSGRRDPADRFGSISQNGLRKKQTEPRDTAPFDLSLQQHVASGLFGCRRLFVHRDLRGGCDSAVRRSPVAGAAAARGGGSAARGGRSAAGRGRGAARGGRGRAAGRGRSAAGVAAAAAGPFAALMVVMPVPFAVLRVGVAAGDRQDRSKDGQRHPSENLPRHWCPPLSESGETRVFAVTTDVSHAASSII